MPLQNAVKYKKGGDLLNIYKIFKCSIYVTFILTILYPLPCKGYVHNTSQINILHEITPQNKDFIINKNNNKLIRKQSKLQNDLYQYLLVPNQRDSIKNRAIKLNNGNQHNSCVYFVSEALRKIGLKIPLRVCNIGRFKSKNNSNLSLIKQLKFIKWKTSNSLSLLLPGDICFTTPDYNGLPSHVYVFMGWVKSGRVDYAYVCDNQSYDYGFTLHIRNIKNSLPGKEAFYSFIYSPITY